ASKPPAAVTSATTAKGAWRGCGGTSDNERGDFIATSLCRPSSGGPAPTCCRREGPDSTRPAHRSPAAGSMACGDCSANRAWQQGTVAGADGGRKLQLNISPFPGRVPGDRSYDVHRNRSI